MKYKNLLFTGLLFTALTSEKDAVSALQLNIIFILADALGYDDVGFHGSHIKTPNLDALAQNGTDLQQYYVQPACTPSRSQLLSGRYQIHTGLQHGDIAPSVPNGLPLELPTMADKLREAGYSTHMVGKWHLGFYKTGYLPTRRGFDSFYGFLTGAEDYYSHHVCDGNYTVTSGGQTKASAHALCGLDFRDNEEPVLNASGRYSTQLFTERAVQVIRKHNASKPLFLMVSYQAVHAPLQVPDIYLHLYDWIPELQRRIYCGMVTCMDEGVGNITKALKTTGLWNNTVIVFSTDSGGDVTNAGNNWDMKGGRGGLWEGGIKGVGLVSSPLFNFSVPMSTMELIHVSDWFPTLVTLGGGNLMNGSQPLSLDGFNQWPTISKDARSPREEVLHSIDPLEPPVGQRLYNDTFDTRCRAALRVGEWKLMTGNPGNGSNATWPPESSPSHKAMLTSGPAHGSQEQAKNVWLYHVYLDPYERQEVSAQNPDLVRLMLNRLQFYNSSAVTARSPPPDARADPRLHGGVWGPWL